MHGLGAILGSFAGFIDLARMKAVVLDGDRDFLFGMRRKRSFESKAAPRFDSPSYDGLELRIEACRIRPIIEQALFPFHAPT